MKLYDNNLEKLKRQLENDDNIVFKISGIEGMGMSDYSKR